MLNKVILTLKDYLYWLPGLNRGMKNGDEIIDTDAFFYRRVYSSGRQYIIKETGRPTSRAFSPRPKDEGELSVDLTSLTTPVDSVGDLKKFCLWEIGNVDVRKIDLRAFYNPMVKKKNGFDNPAHCVISGFEEEDESKAGILARKSIKVDI